MNLSKMKSDNPHVQNFINYLTIFLCAKDKFYGANFKKIGPRTFLFKDKTDTIFVQVQDKNLIIITDGECVIDCVEMLPLNLTESNDEIFDSLTQNILACF